MRRTKSALRIAAMLSVGLGVPVLYCKQPMCTSAVAGRSVDVSPERLREDVETIVGFGPRDSDSLGNDAVADWILASLRASGLEAEAQSFDVPGVARPSRNIVARAGPRDGPRVVVGAHYDACGPHPAADDNASGVAVLLELARSFAAAPPEGAVELVAFANEEPPHFAEPTMGSVHHADALAKDRVEVLAMISLEMVGYYDERPGTQSYPVALLSAIYPDRGNFVAVIGEIGGAGLVRTIKGAMRESSTLPVESINAPASIPGVDFSDHRSYWARGFPAVMVTDTAFYRNERYHTAEDLPSTLDYERMADVTAGVSSAVRALHRR
jgi:hypothetical protein